MTSPERSQRGTAVVEFALGFTLLWLMFSGLYQVGYAFYVYNLLLTSVTNATLLGAKLDYDTSSAGTYTTSLQNMVVYGDTTAGTRPVVPNLTTSMVNVVMSPSTSMPQDVTITISGYSIDAVFTSFQLTNKPRATSLYYGRIICSGC